MKWYLQKRTSALFFLLLISSAGIAQNPVIQSHFSPDPAPMVYNGRVYMYTGDDIPGYSFYYMTKWRVHSSSDMVNWTDHGSPISLESFVWAKDRAWASQCIERNGKFYWYICAQTVQNNMSIGVAVADKPTGPFKDALGKPLISTGSWSNIDPTVHIDDDGQAYLYWGNGALFYVKLNKDMISYKDSIVTVPLSKESFGGVRPNRPPGSPRPDSTQPRPVIEDMFIEGPWFYKRNGMYYQMFAGMTSGTECLSYSMSNSPTGPWVYKGKIMNKQATNSFTNHGGIIDFKGKSYIFYHNGLLPNGGSYGRASAIEEFTYNADGTIPSINITKEGVKPVGTLDPYTQQEAETSAWAEKCKIDEDKKTGVYLTQLRIDSYVKVREVDFGVNSPKSFTATLASGLDGGIVEVHIDSVAGTKITEIKVTRTGGWLNWKKFTSNIDKVVTGKHDVYFVFKGEHLTVGRELFNFDKWIFNK